MKIQKSSIKQYILILAVMILALLPVSALTINNCYYDTNPYFNYFNSISWVCEVSHSTNCITYVKDNGSIIQTNPDIRYVKDVGIISTYECNAVCNLEFSTSLLRDNYTYMFSVACENVTYEREVTPLLNFNEQQTTGRIVWFKDNIQYVIGGFALALIVVVLIVVIFSYFKRYA